MYITENIQYAGVNDHEITLFERQYPVANGMSYNSYVIMDEKIAVMDTVDSNFTEQWLLNLAQICNGRQPDFLVIQHMEPDHSSGIRKFMECYPEAVIVASAKAFIMLKQFFHTSYENRRIVVQEGDRLCLGVHSLSFLEAPMVHWPEVIMALENHTGSLFSADAFGKFGALDREEKWAAQARRYYAGIVGKYGACVNQLLDKAESLPLQRICPLHGPVLQTNLPYYINLYRTWANYLPEDNGILIVHTSMYGNTQKAARLLADMLQKASKNVPPQILLLDLTDCDISAAVSHVFRCKTLVLATTTYNGGIFPRMREFLNHLTERNLQNRQIALIENGSWAPNAANIIKRMLEKQKNITFFAPEITIHSSVSEENRRQLKELAKAILSSC